jgi:uncharacterized membrane protein (UPF0127 family)
MRYSWLLLALICCSCGPQTMSLDELQSRTVRLPSGREVRAEVVMKPADMQRGMMYRESLPVGQGMLFIHTKPGNFAYWMYNVKMPLDIVWMDDDRRVVEVVANAQPCKTKASECPNYGGQMLARYVLELPAGEAARNRVEVGSVLAF